MGKYSTLIMKVRQRRIHSGSLIVVPPRSLQSQVGTQAFHSGIGGHDLGAGLLDVCLAIPTTLKSAHSLSTSFGHRHRVPRFDHRTGITKPSCCRF